MAKEFPQFDVVSDASDHYFVAKQPKPSISELVHKEIMYDRELLAKELPDSIYVRAYENRVDLLRAAIVGVQGTPYHDGLFFFDIAFPSDYPAQPPLVHYRSFGFQINPNILDDGGIFLSLLDTWYGKKCERWNPEGSTIFQVLLSLQALVLNEKPYFNVSLFFRAFPWLWERKPEKKSLAYSEFAFIGSCRTMLSVLNNPPRNFEPLVKQHFMDRASFILNACDMYRKGLVKVGMFDGAVEKGEGVLSTKSNIILLDNLFGHLVEAFATNGASVDYFVEQGKKENASKEKTDAKTEKKVSMVKKLKNKLVGLMKKKPKTSRVLDAAQDTGSQTVN